MLVAGGRCNRVQHEYSSARNGRQRQATTARVGSEYTQRHGLRYPSRSRGRRLPETYFASAVSSWIAVAISFAQKAMA